MRNILCMIHLHCSNSIVDKHRFWNDIVWTYVASVEHIDPLRHQVDSAKLFQLCAKVNQFNSYLLKLTKNNYDTHKKVAYCDVKGIGLRERKRWREKNNEKSIMLIKMQRLINKIPIQIAQIQHHSNASFEIHNY